MPNILNKNIGNGVLAVWEITENEQELRQIVSPADLDSVLSMNSGARRCERLAWRAMLKAIKPHITVTYNNLGAPIANNTNEHISVSHCSNMAAIVLCTSRCAIDIESLDRNFARIRSRYITNVEATLPDSNDPHFAAALWCAKEVLYKYSQRKELDLLTDIHITDTNFEAQKIWGQIDNGTTIEMNILTIDGNLIVYTAD